MRTLFTAITMVMLLAAPAAATEEGAIFNEEDGTCVEAGGAPGLSTFDGQCVTEADYDIIFGYENLASVSSLVDPSRSVVEVRHIDSVIPASLRLVGVGVLDEPFTFRALVNGMVAL